MKQERVPMKQERILMKQERVTMKQERVPMKQERVPMKQEIILMKQERVKYLPPKHLIQLIFFKLQVSRFSISRAVGNCTIKKIFDQHFHFFLG